jgi:hypothetical protein
MTSLIVTIILFVFVFHIASVECKNEKGNTKLYKKIKTKLNPLLKPVTIKIACIGDSITVGEGMLMCMCMFTMHVVVRIFCIACVLAILFRTIKSS